MAVKHVSRPRKQCPLYCTTDHKRGAVQHAHLIAEVDVAGDRALVAVNFVRPEQADEIELAIGRGFNEPIMTNMTADEARELRDALNVAVALLDRT